MSEERKSQADESGGLDNLFRSTLTDHQIEPSGRLWKGINRKLLRAELAHFNLTNIPKALWVGTSSVVLIGILVLLSQIPDGKISENNYSPIIIKNNHPLTTSAFSPGTTVTGAEKEATPVLAATLPALMDKTHVQSASIPSSLSLTEKQYRENNSFILCKYVLPSGDNLANEFERLHTLSVRSLSPFGIEDTLLRFENLKGILNVPFKANLETPRFFSFDMGISPEISMYRNAGNYSEANYWLNAGMTYHVGRFSVQSGVGIGYVFDRGNYKVNYRSKDSIGYFTSIISFTVTPGDIVVYATKDIPVYDSVQHLADDRAVSRYTYLRIPLMLGYELVETNRFSVGIMAGPAISFLIGSKEASPFINYPGASLIRVDNNSLTRVKMNWEVQAALNIEYRLVKSFSIYAKPYYKHYFKPFENQESAATAAKDPYSLGIEIGARVNFRQKRKKP